jgi:hypothetical protein
MDNNFIHIRKNHKLELRGGGIIENVKKHKSTLLKIAGGVAVPATALIVNALLNGNKSDDDEWIKLNIENTPGGGKTLTQEWAYIN